MSFKFEELNDNLFEKLIAFSFAKDADEHLTIEYYGGNEAKIIFHMDVTTGNILEIDENGRYTVLPKWEE